MNEPVEIRVRIAGPSDTTALAALRRKIRAEDADTSGDLDFERRFAAWIEAEGDRRTTWLAEDSGVLIGSTSLFEYRRMPAPDRPDSAWGYLANMAVVAERREAGVGSALLVAALAAADERGYARVVLAPSVRSIPFYRRAGFIDAGADAVEHRLMVRSV